MAQKAHTSLAEQHAAAEAEGIFVPTAEQMRLIRRHRQLADLIKQHKAEQGAIEATLKSQMDSVGAERLAADGQNVAQWIDVSTTVLDENALAAAYPSVVALYKDVTAKYNEAAANFLRPEKKVHARFMIR